MPRTGNGNYVLPPGNPVVTDTVITSDWANTTMPDLGAAISSSIAADGQTTPSANLPMGGFHHLSVSDPTLRDQYASLGMVQDSRHTRVTITSGPNVLTGTLIGQMTSYSPGMVLNFQALANNTTAVTLNVNGIGAVPVVDTKGVDLLPGDITAGNYYIVMYNGVAFSVISGTSGGTSTVSQNKTTGQNRPPAGYAPLTQVDANTIRVPAGSAVVVPPGDVSSSNTINVSWAAQDVTLLYLATQFSTTIAVDTTGAVVQYPGMPSEAAYRDSVVLGTVSHVNGVIATVTTKGLTFGDDGYLGKDVSLLVSNVITAGGRVTVGSPNTLHLDIEAGTIFSVGADIASEDTPNSVNFNAANDLSFFPVTGTNVVGTATQVAPITNYDPNGAGTVTAIGGGTTTTTIHRLFWLYGTWVWSYGQKIYSDLNTGLAQIIVDRSDYLMPSKLSDATLVCEIVAQRNCTNLGDPLTAHIINAGGFNFQIGQSGSIGEAPADGNVYGRRNAAWSRAVGMTGDTMTGSLLFRMNQPAIELSSPTNVNGYRMFSDVTDAVDSGYRIDRRSGGSWVLLMNYNGGVFTFNSTFAMAGDVRATATGAEARQAIIGYGRIGNGDAMLGLVSDATYPNGGFRAYRNAGANGATQLLHNGTGGFSMEATGLAKVALANNGVERLVVDAATGVVSFPGSTAPHVVTGNAATSRYVGYATGATTRWRTAANAINESGSNAGSNWVLEAYDDTGTLLSTPITVTRATGVVAFAVSPTAPTAPPATTGNQLATLDYVLANAGAGIPDAPANGTIYGRKDNAWAPVTGAAGGTVTSVSVVSANGVSGTVANPTSAPAITLALGAITPVSVAASGGVYGNSMGANGGAVTGSPTSLSLCTNASTGANGAVRLLPDGYNSSVGMLVANNTQVTHNGVVLPNKTYVDAQVGAKLNRDPTVQLLASASTITAADTDDVVIVSALAVPAVIANPPGAAPNERRLWFRIKDNGTARALSWGSEFRSCGQTLPLTTTAGKIMRVGFLRNSTDIRWDCVALAQEV